MNITKTFKCKNFIGKLFIYFFQFVGSKYEVSRRNYEYSGFTLFQSWL